MSSPESLQRAIEAARAGRKEEARDLLIQIVENDPENETAWIWLSGLVDSLDDRIIACENALTLNPANEKVRAYLAELQEQQRAREARRNNREAVRLLEQARSLAARRETTAALQLAMQAVELHPSNEDAWLFIGTNSPELDEQIAALKKANQLNPSNQATSSALRQARHLKANPLSAAMRLEQLGRYDEALGLYQDLAAKTRDSKEFDHIYRQIVRIEALQKENIRHIAPASSIIRLSFAWPALYLSLALIQVGLSPLTHRALYLWLGLPFVILGSFLLSVAEVRSTHFVWQKLFDEHGDGSMFARLVTASTGWVLILVPHVLLVFDSLNRLRTFRIP